MKETHDEKKRMRNRDMSGKADTHGRMINPALPPMPEHLRNVRGCGHVVRNAVEVIIRP